MNEIAPYLGIKHSLLKKFKIYFKYLKLELITFFK
jgi:hypothetical protein